MQNRQQNTASEQILQAIDIDTSLTNYTIEIEEALRGYKVTMYSVITDAFGEELRSRVVEKSYKPPSPPPSSLTASPASNQTPSPTKPLPSRANTSNKNGMTAFMMAS